MNGLLANKINTKIPITAAAKNPKNIISIEYIKDDITCAEDPDPIIDLLAVSMIFVTNSLTFPVIV